MYNIIQNIINHSWQSNYSGEQPYIYCISCVLITVVVVTFISWIFRAISYIISLPNKD